MSSAVRGLIPKSTGGKVGMASAIGIAGAYAGPRRRSSGGNPQANRGGMFRRKIQALSVQGQMD